MNTDMQLQRDVMEGLNREPSVTASAIGVAIRNGLVALSGTVSTYTEKYAAERTALRVSGVRTVCEAIQVKGAGTHKQSDIDIAEAVLRALQTTDRVPPNVQATVENGWVTLQGEVTEELERNAAMDAVRHQAGMERIYNLITLKPTAQPAVARDGSTKAWRGIDSFDAAPVLVLADGGNGFHSESLGAQPNSPALCRSLGMPAE